MKLINRKQPVKGPLTVKPRTASGQLEVFKEIWNERPHVCFVTGRPIKEFNVWCFAHVLAKGTYSRYKLKKENIVLMLPSIHQIYDHGSRKTLAQYPGYPALQELHLKLKYSYTQETKPAHYGQK